MPLYAVVTREYFGDRAMGTAYGGVFFISCMGMGLGSFAGGIIHDGLGSYLWLFLGLGRHRHDGHRDGLHPPTAEVRASARVTQSGAFRR